MNREPAPATIEPTSERRFQGPLQAWELAFLLALASVLLWTAIWQSGKQYLETDEFFTALLVSNPSFSVMWSAVRHGGELNPPLYFILEWVVARCCGSSELALRALSTVSVVLAGWVLFFTARPLTGPRIAALAVALILGLSRDVFYFASCARYYGVLFLLVSLALFLALRLGLERPLRRRDCVLVFLVHLALVYLHIYGLFFSGVLLLAMAATDWLNGKWRWSLHASILAAWAAFGAWLPSMLQQLKPVGAGTYVPPNYNALGYFADELALQTPLAFVLIFVALLGALGLLSAPRSEAIKEINACSAPLGWSALAISALAIMAVPFGTWAGSLVKPGLFMRRYIFPCTAAWVLLLALVLLAVFRLPQATAPRRSRVSPRLWSLTWFGVLAFCLLFQPLRARKNPARPAVPFADDDYGYKNLPMVFEDSWYFLPRAFYGQGRSYLLLIDHAASEADSGWYTKWTERFFQPWYPACGKARIAHYNDLPDEFLAVDDDYAKTFEWLFQHRPELKQRLLGTRQLEVKEHGQQRVYLVQRVPADKSKP